MPSKALLPLGEKKVLLWQGSNEGETCGEGEAMPEATRVGQRKERGARWRVPLQVMREVGGGWRLEVARRCTGRDAAGAQGRGGEDG